MVDDRRFAAAQPLPAQDEFRVFHDFEAFAAAHAPGVQHLRQWAATFRVHCRTVWQTQESVELQALAWRPAAPVQQARIIGTQDARGARYDLGEGGQEQPARAAGESNAFAKFQWLAAGFHLSIIGCAPCNDPGGRGVKDGIRGLGEWRNASSATAAGSWCRLCGQGSSGTGCPNGGFERSARFQGVAIDIAGVDGEVQAAHQG